MRWAKNLTVTIVLGLFLLLTACGGSNKGDASSGSGSGANGAAVTPDKVAGTWKVAMRYHRDSANNPNLLKGLYTIKIDSSGKVTRAQLTYSNPNWVSSITSQSHNGRVNSNKFSLRSGQKIDLSGGGTLLDVSTDFRGTFESTTRLSGNWDRKIVCIDRCKGITYRAPQSGYFTAAKK